MAFWVGRRFGPEILRGFRPYPTLPTATPKSITSFRSRDNRKGKVRKQRPLPCGPRPLIERGRVLPPGKTSNASTQTEDTLIVPRTLSVVAEPTTAFSLYRDGSTRHYLLREDVRLRAILTSVPQKNYPTHASNIFVDYFSFPVRDLQISRDAKRSLEIDNAGGKSAISEMFSIEYFIRAFRARKILCEMEVGYWFDCNMVDFVCSIPRFPQDSLLSRASRVGVSVTRAMGYPTPEEFTYEQGLALLRKKLYGLIIARNSVVKAHSFYKSVLHVWCQTPRIATLLRKAYASFDICDYGLNIKGVVVLHLTVCPSEYIYSNYVPDDLLVS